MFKSLKNIRKNTCFFNISRRYQEISKNLIHNQKVKITLKISEYLLKCNFHVKTYLILIIKILKNKEFVTNFRKTSFLYITHGIICLF